MLSSCTIKDVAKIAGVSISTVSRVINGNYPVADTKKTQVLEAIKTLHYTPNVMASSLRTNRSKTIGVIAPKFSSETYSGILSGTEAIVKKAGFKLLISSTDNLEEEELEAIEAMCINQVEAILIAPSKTKINSLKTIQNKNIPIILLDYPISQVQTDLVSGDDEEASASIVDYLISQGHRKIGIVMSDNDFPITRSRYLGFTDALKSHSIKPNPQWQLRCGITREEAKKVFRGFLLAVDRREIPTAFFATSKSIAAGIVEASLELGFNIPEDLSIVAFGDMNIPSTMQPQITCVVRDPIQIGESAGKLVVERIRQKNQGIEYSPETIIIHSHIKYGTSVKSMG